MEFLMIWFYLLKGDSFNLCQILFVFFIQREKSSDVNGELFEEEHEEGM